MPRFYARRRLSVAAAATALLSSVARFNAPTASPPR